MRVLVLIVVVVLVLAAWVSWTASRLDRLHARLDAAEAALDAQLVRRAVAAEALPRELAGDRTDEVREAARAARESTRSEREAVENDLSRVLRGLRLDTADPRVAELRGAASRVGLARQFYNDAVRDTRALRYQRMPRLLHLAVRVPVPAYFEIAGTGLADPDPSAGQVARAPRMEGVPESERGT